jgi:hypothetical protein
VSAQDQGGEEPVTINSGWRSQTYTKSADFSERVEQVSTGMTRQQVINLLGPFDLGLTPIDMGPICDSYGFLSDGEQKFLQVWYELDDLVDRVFVSDIGPCAVV